MFTSARIKKIFRKIIKSYFSNIQNDFSEIESDIEKDFSLDDKNLNIKKDKEKNE